MDQNHEETARNQLYEFKELGSNLGLKFHICIRGIFPNNMAVVIKNKVKDFIRISRIQKDAGDV